MYVFVFSVMHRIILGSDFLSSFLSLFMYTFIYLDQKYILSAEYPVLF